MVVTLVSPNAFTIATIAQLSFRRLLFVLYLKISLLQNLDAGTGVSGSRDGTGNGKRPVRSGPVPFENF